MTLEGKSKSGAPFLALGATGWQYCQFFFCYVANAELRFPQYRCPVTSLYGKGVSVVFAVSVVVVLFTAVLLASAESSKTGNRLDDSADRSVKLAFV